MNEPERYELFVLPEGVEKLSLEKDTKVPNAATFTIQCEDHTLGNLLRMNLLENDKVLFAGYKIPHPLENYLLLRIQTVPESTPSAALQQALSDLVQSVAVLEETFKEQMSGIKSREGTYL
ncbi:RNA polymerase II core subunit [Thecamonas trahens ATCC 50062]|uniref:RNA polymerase II core subunit n=1 Tax=Thecamonas trahens ATCC 50062 TaxID=461836 RepID=A0A0L0D176_THETB|nr:RNA polymerase II core subunit [Thecamonas trahens ATCC 50062]KNC46109.1 RNA polymerase II core subunit [Thecamonas trahens ATCC 50062]|eukprot:XP_013763087.1 RNA polymerase II core subunit [Thecamonas trahens ATCC 50062]